MYSIYKTIGSFKHYESCRFCFSKDIETVIDLGIVPKAGGFLKSKKLFYNEDQYPLTLVFCKNCFLLQSNNVIEKDTIFKNYFYHSSVVKTLVNHFENVGKKLSNELSKKVDPFVLEIGSNDATLVAFLAKRGIKTVGVDPAKNIVVPLQKKGLPLINEYFTNSLAKKILKKYGFADRIVSFNTLAHIEDMHDVFQGIDTLLKKDGVLFFEVHYIGNLIQEMQYDMIYHEHQYYYSLHALKNFLNSHNMEIFDVKPIQIHRGSMRYYVQKKNGGKNTVKKSVHKLLSFEKKQKLIHIDTFKKYNSRIKKTKTDLVGLLTQLKQKNKKIAGYGASGRGTIISNYCAIDDTFLEYVIDDAPAKQGTYMPGTHVKIVSSGKLYGREKPDYVLLFAWSFYEEIAKKHKKFLDEEGRFIIPLPKVKVIDKNYEKE